MNRLLSVMIACCPDPVSRLCRCGVALPQALGGGAIALTLLITPACRKVPVNQNPGTPAAGATPVLRITVLPIRNPAEQRQLLAPLDAYLEQELGQPVDFMIAKSYDDHIQMLVDRRANAAYTGALSYLKALDRGAKIRPLVAPIDQTSARPWIRSCIVVRANSPIKTLADLRGKRVAFVDPSSTSGYLMPLGGLHRLGIEPNRDFAGVVFGRSHAKNEDLLVSEQVDAIATSLPAYLKFQSQGKLTAANSRVIWTSEPVPNSPFLVATDLPPDLIQKLTTAFLTTPAGMKDILGADVIGYTQVDESSYEPIQRLQRQLGLTGAPTQP